MPVLPLLLLAATFEPTGGVLLSCQENLRGKTGRARVQVVVGVGALHEGEAERGAAHLLEHLVLRPLGFDDGNGATGWDYTSYHRDVRAEQLLPSAEALLRELKAPRLPDADVEVEKRIVLRELEDRGTSHIETQNDPLFHNTLLARYPGGSADAVRDLDAGALANFHQRHYVRGNMAVLLRGAVDCAAARTQLEPLLEAFARGPAADVPRVAQAEPGQLVLPSYPGRFSAGYYWYDAGPGPQVVYQLVAKYLEQMALNELRKERGLTYSPSASFSRRGPGGQITLSVQTEGSDRAVQGWYEDTVQALLTDSAPLARLQKALPEVREALENDGESAGLAAIRGQPEPIQLLDALNDTQLRSMLPALLSPRRAFGSAVPQSNVGSLIILVIFGGLVLGAIYVAAKGYMGR